MFIARAVIKKSDAVRRRSVYLGVRYYRHFTPPE